jgi:hypothetical protein
MPKNKSTKAFANKIAKDYPLAKAFFYTSDGMMFLTREEAESQASHLADKHIDEVKPKKQK